MYSKLNMLKFTTTLSFLSLSNCKIAKLYTCKLHDFDFFPQKFPAYLYICYSLWMIKINHQIMYQVWLGNGLLNHVPLIGISNIASWNKKR